MVTIRNYPSDTIDVEVDVADVVTAVEATTTAIQDSQGTHDSAAPVKITVVGSVAETTTPAAVADGDAVRIWTDEYGRPVNPSFNQSDSADDNTIINFPSAAPMQETKTTLTAAGVTDAIGVSGKVYHAISYTIAFIDTNVVVRAEGSINDGATYFNLSAAGVDTTKTVNDTFPMTYIGKLSHIRFRFVSETGGTYATITPSFMSGN